MLLLIEWCDSSASVELLLVLVFPVLQTDKRRGGPIEEGSYIPSINNMIEKLVKVQEDRDWGWG